jgi:cytochrome c oxidase subunit 3
MENIEFKIIEEARKPLAMHPKKFAMWLFLASVVMLFASLTSAYIVKQSDGNWAAFDLPYMFYATTVVILLSSVTMQWSFVATKKDNFATANTMIWLTFGLGFFFLVGQAIGWTDMYERQIKLEGNPSGSFVYILTGLHLAHIVSALVYVLVIRGAVASKKVNSSNMARLEMCATYWHFLGGLWLYLFVFLLLNR